MTEEDKDREAFEEAVTKPAHKLMPLEPTIEILQAMSAASKRPVAYDNDISKDSWFTQALRMYRAALGVQKPPVDKSQDGFSQGGSRC